MTSDDVSRDQAAEVAGEARAWTSMLMRSVLEEPIRSERQWVPASPSPLVDLTDVRAEVVGYGDQLRVCERFELTIPVLIVPSTRLPMPVDLTAAVGTEIPEARTDVENWLDGARSVVRGLAGASSMEYEELAVPQVWGIVEAATNAFVSVRFLPSLFSGTKVPTYPIRVHTTASALRVHYSLNITWNPVVFGAPSPTVAGKLQAGRYQFGVDGKGVAMMKDTGVFDVPQVQDAYLTVA